MTAADRMSAAAKRTDTRLAIQHVLTTLRLDEGATERILRDMPAEEIRALAVDALLLHDRAHDHLRDRANREWESSA